MWNEISKEGILFRGKGQSLFRMGGTPLPQWRTMGEARHSLGGNRALTQSVSPAPCRLWASRQHCPCWSWVCTHWC